LDRSQRPLHFEGAEEQVQTRRVGRCIGGGRWHRHLPLVSTSSGSSPGQGCTPAPEPDRSRPVQRVKRRAARAILSGAMRGIAVTTPLIIDSDLALDDWMALAFLLQSPEVDVRAITVAATGEAHAGPGVKNTLRLMALTGVEGIPVASGRTTPLAGTHRFPLALRLAMDFRLGLGLPRPRTRPSGGSAVALLRRTLLEAPAPCTLLALGPLTNLAQLFEG